MDTVVVLPRPLSVLREVGSAQDGPVPPPLLRSGRLPPFLCRSLRSDPEVKEILSPQQCLFSTDHPLLLLLLLV